MTVELQIPDELYEKVCDLAVQQQKPLVDFLTASLAEYVRRVEGSADMETPALKIELPLPLGVPMRTPDNPLQIVKRLPNDFDL